MTTIFVRRFLVVVSGLGLALCTELPAFSQTARLVTKGVSAWSQTGAIIPVLRPSFPLKGAKVSPVLGKRASEILNPAQQQVLSNKIERQIFNQSAERGYVTGYYRPDHTDTRNIIYLQRVQKELKALYPQTKRRFAPLTANSLEELLQVWKNGPAEENFMSAGSATEVLVLRTTARRSGYYALAVEKTSASGRAVHDILILDVNNARWISLRKSLAAAHPMRQQPQK